MVLTIEAEESDKRSNKQCKRRKTTKRYATRSLHKKNRATKSFFMFNAFVIMLLPSFCEKIKIVKVTAMPFDVVNGCEVKFMGKRCKREKEN
jgi:hypothetical protein